MEHLQAPEWALAPVEAQALALPFIRATVEAAGASGLVVGLSGGIDSAVAAGLAVAALGADRVRGVLMPYRSSSPASQSAAEAVAAVLGLPTELREITPMADAFLGALDAGGDRIRAGNVMARCRMVVLYDVSARDGSLVLGTGNRTEALLGYTTLYGDNACGLNPLADLYKTEVRLLAAHLGLPESVRTKAPSADLWSDQTDEGELGFTYAEADRLLHHMIDEGLGDRQLGALGFAPDLVAKVRARVAATAFKRRLPPTAAVPGRPAPEGDRA